MDDITSRRWTGAQFIELAHHLNEQCIEWICDRATTQPVLQMPPFLLQNRDLWIRCPADARRHLAQLPFVIVDVHFQDIQRWIKPGDPHSPHSTPSACKLTEDLMLETLLFARQAAREDIHVAKAVFGTTAKVAEHIASLSLHRVRWIALHNTDQLRVRWDHDAAFWSEFLTSAIRADEHALKTLRHHAKRLFCGEIIRSRIA